ncbi:glycosyltransferase family 1 protein [bacterium]|nr:glycosyltransferase family 1 protein [bacterium]
MRIAWISNLPENVRSASASRRKATDSLAAYTTGVLIPHLMKWDDISIELFHRGEAGTCLDLPVFPYQRLRERHAQHPYDICLYQVEDHPESQWARIACTLMPGITWFHDLYFASHGPEPILNSAWQVTKERFLNGSASWAERGGEFEQVAPIAAREATFCLLPLFSVERDALEYRRAIGGSLAAPFCSEKSPAYFLPLPVRDELFSAAPRDDEVGKRLRIALHSGARIEQRSHQVLQALRVVQPALDFEVHWVVSPDEKSRAEALLEEFDLREGAVTLESELSPTVWAAVLEKSDVAIHPRFSVFGHVQPYVGMSLARGVPTIVTRFGASEELPAELVYQIEPGVEEPKQIAQVLTAISSGDAPHNAVRGQEYAREMYHEGAIATQLVSLLKSTIGSGEYQNACSAWNAFEKSASEDLMKEVSEMLHAEPTLQAPFESEFQKVCNEFGW